MLIINADDWGRSEAETESARRCFEVGAITSVSAMVFMDGSERAAGTAKTTGVDVGLHLNFSQAWTSRAPSPRLREQQRRLVRFLSANKFAQIFYRPDLRSAFRDVVSGQTDEFVRLYGRPPSHIDGHQHMHLCANMVVDRIIPAGQKVRRNFSFARGEKGFLNRAYRRAADWWLGRNYRMTDYFFALSQSLNDDALRRIVSLAQSSDVELMTHPAQEAEYACLTSDVFRQIIASVPLGSYQMLKS